ncbi:hypothetical protein Gotur_024694, partial [Gossypium turneri]
DFCSVRPSYTTLPLYAFGTQVIFEEHIRKGLIGWVRKAKKKNKGSGIRRSLNDSSQVGPKQESPLVFEMDKVNGKESSSSAV